LEFSELIKKKYFEIFDDSPSFSVKAPGRINFLGEHTDYNGGFVLPAGIDKAIYFSISSRSDKKVAIHAFDLEDYFEWNDISTFPNTCKGWQLHLFGAIQEILKLNFSFSHGFNLCFGGDIPLGAGLSSSAALTSGFIFALNHLYDLPLTKLEMAKIAQNTEHNYVGVKCGIMDMYASIFSKVNHLIQLNCATITHKYVPFESSDCELVLINSSVKHTLADTAYNQRRRECNEGLAALKKLEPSIAFLSEANLKQLDQIKNEVSAIVFNRCKYVLEENERVEKANDLLSNGQFEDFGKLMNETHLGLSKLYEVSCEELDFLQNTAQKLNGVLGSRMMGGGFGGCTLNLIKKSEIALVVETIVKEFKNKYGIIPPVYYVTISAGVNFI